MSTLNLPQLENGGVCQSKQYCKLCREVEGGRALRRFWSRSFLLPGNKVDFKCPFGKWWIGDKRLLTNEKQKLPSSKKSPRILNSNDPPELIKRGVRYYMEGAYKWLKATLKIGITSEREWKRRLTICESCDYSEPKDKPVKERTCSFQKGGCGCGVSKKAILEKEQCPLKKWA